MKKVLTFLAAVMLLASASNAQTARRHVAMTKAERNAPVAARLMNHQSPVVSKAAGDTIGNFPWLEDFESISAGFSYVDNDGDGDNWVRETSRVSTHSGTCVIRSASWSQTTEAALTPDNWMVLPAMQLPANADEYTLSWWVIGQDANYAEEHYSVYVCTTGRTVADFTANAPVYDGMSTANFERQVVDLSAYAGQVVYIAFRHWNSTDMFWLCIDDIRVGGAEPPAVSIDGPGSVEVNTPVSFSASGASSFTWTVDNTVQSETGDTLTYTFETVGLHTVVASATNNAGTGADTLFVEVYDCSIPITSFPWTEEFDGELNCWSFLTADPVDNGFVITNTGLNDDYSLIGAYSDDVNTNQWAISPLFTLPTEATDYILKYYVLMRDWEGVVSHYQVLLSTTGSADTADFSTVLIDETGSDGTYLPRTIDLGNYAGQSIRIALHNITPVTGDAINFDALYIGVPLVPDMSLDGPELVIMNEEASWTANTDASQVEWSVDGNAVNENGTVLNYTFSTPGTHTISASATNNAGTASDEMVVEVIDCSHSYDLPHTFDLATEFGPCWKNPEDGWDTITDGGEMFLYSMSNLYGYFELNPDNWIYTPALTMPASGSFEIAWDVKPYVPTLPNDHYGVYLVQGDNQTLLRQETLNSNMTSPRSRAVAIPAGTTGEFKIAFRHYETTGGYVIMINNIRVVAAGTVGIDDVENGSVSLYPNPVANTLTVSADGVSEVQLIDVNGRVVLSSNHAGDIDVSTLAEGMYIVRVVTATGVSTSKIVKK